VNSGTSLPNSCACSETRRSWVTCRRTFWLNGGKQLRGVVVPVFQEIYLQQARELLQQFTVGVDWALVNQGAVDWSSRYAFDLVTGITDRTRAGAVRRCRRILPRRADDWRPGGHDLPVLWPGAR
jgi:hypothetical protein